VGRSEVTNAGEERSELMPRPEEPLAQATGWASRVRNDRANWRWARPQPYRGPAALPWLTTKTDPPQTRQLQELGEQIFRLVRFVTELLVWRELKDRIEVPQY
jgi:hypothetical protein